MLIILWFPDLSCICRRAVSGEFTQSEYIECSNTTNPNTAFGSFNFLALRNKKLKKVGNFLSVFLFLSNFLTYVFISLSFTGVLYYDVL
jgi:hypothetical protein